MAAITAAVVAVGVGSAMNAKAKGDAADAAAKSSRWNGFGVNGGGGNISFDDQGNMTTANDSQNQMFQDFFGSGAQNIMAGGGFGAGAAAFADQAGTNALPGAFAGANAASQQTANGAFQQFGQFSQQNAQFGQQAGMSALAQANDFGSREFGANEQFAQGLFGQGQNALNNTDFTQQADEQIARQRAFARPGEDRAVNSKFQNLFNKGALSSTGGARQIGELGLQQEMADIQRVNSGNAFGQQLTQDNRQFGLNAMQQGFGARDSDRAFNQQRAGLFANQGQQLMNFGGQQAQAGLNSQVMQSEMINSRGQQRLQNAQGMLGFGQGIQNNNFAQLMQMFGGNLAGNQSQQNLMALSGNLSSQRSAANAKSGQIAVAGAGSPFGSFLEGAGSAFLGAQGGGA